MGSLYALSQVSSSDSLNYSSSLNPSLPTSQLATPSSPSLTVVTQPSSAPGTVHLHDVISPSSPGWLTTVVNVTSACSSSLASLAPSSFESPPRSLSWIGLVSSPTNVDQEGLGPLEIRRLLDKLNERLQRHEIDLAKVMALLMEQPHLMPNPSTRQSTLAAESLSDLVVIASGDVLPPTDHSQDSAGLCVALATSERTNSARLRRIESASCESVDFRHQLRQPSKKRPGGKLPRFGRLS